VGLPRSNLVKPKSPPTAFEPVVDPFGSTQSPPEPAPAETVSRESFRTKADSVEIQIDAPRAPLPSAPSANELVERATAMGPMRMTWESIVLPSDPVLDEKRQPHVAERRARLTRVVKVALGACLGLCVLALGVSAISGGNSSSPSAASAAIGKAVPSKGVVPVEKLDGTKHAKARRVAPVATTAAVVRPTPKHR